MHLMYERKDCTVAQLLLPLNWGLFIYFLRIHCIAMSYKFSMMLSGAAV